MRNPHHACRVFGSPWEGVHGTSISSNRHYGRHWHATFGVGVIDVLATRHAAHGLPARAASADVSRAREMLADSVAQPPSLTELAASSGLSKYQLLRRFKEVHGVTPFAWLLQQRAEAARGLIRRGTSLTDAATAAGFADQSHMTRAFALHFGFTPGAWQRACTTRSAPLQ